MKFESNPPVGTKATLQSVLDRITADPGLSDGRRRDLCSAVITLTKFVDGTPAQIPLDLPKIRQILDSALPAQANVSRKRWANLRSDLATAIEASGIQPMLKTADIKPDKLWSELLEPVTDRRVRHGLSRFSRWASLRRVAPVAVNSDILKRFIAELDAMTLIRNFGGQRRSAAAAWNRLVELRSNAGLQAVNVPTEVIIAARFDWARLSGSFRGDVESHLAWCAVPDPLDENARARPLAPRTRLLRQNHIHSAVSAAAAAGLNVTRWSSLTDVVQPEVFRAVLRHQWHKGGRALTAYAHGIAGTLVAIAIEWAKVPADIIAILKKDRRKLGALPWGLTDKNQILLRKFDDPKLLDALIHLPDRLWRRARRELSTSRRPFIELQSALAIDLLLHVPLRMENLASLDFKKHLYWPQGRKKPALIVFEGGETKNDIRLEFEVPAALAERLQVYRNEIAPAITGVRPDALFVAWTGKPRTQAAITVAIEKAVLRNLGVRLTPHQFRHLAAKIILDANPGAYELVRQLLGQKNLKTTTNYYAGVDTRRAGRAHSDLILKMRDLDPTRRSSDKPGSGKNSKKK